MIVGGAPNPVLLAASPDPLDEYGVIENSLRFRESASAHATWVPSSMGDRTKWTLSCWVKRGSLNSERMIFVAMDNSQPTILRFNPDNTLEFYHWTTGYVAKRLSNRVFRDLNAWYHLTVSVDTTASIAADRIKVFLEDEELTYSSTIDPAQNYAEMHVSSSSATHAFFWYVAQYTDGYLADAYFIDGQALPPDSFGVRHPTTRQWRPKPYTGSYGTNGFHLDFADNSSAKALGYDVSGNYSLNLRAEGSNIGTFTVNGGLASAFDGNTDQPNASSARVSEPSAGYDSAVIGKSWGAGNAKAITAVRLFSQNDGGFVGGTTNPLTFKLQGSNDGSSWVDLTGAITGPSTGAGTVITVASEITDTNAYLYHRINCNADGANNYYMTELEFYEAGEYGWNHWTPVNISTEDQMLDTPTNNFATLNPLEITNASYQLAADGNLRANCYTGTSTYFKATQRCFNKHWFVANVESAGNGLLLGVTSGKNISTVPLSGVFYILDGTKRVFGTTTSYGASYTSGDTVAVEVDVVNGTIEFFKQTGSTGSFVSQGVITDSGLVSNEMFFVVCNSTSSGTSNTNVNFGQLAKDFVPSTGYLPLCTKNLPMPEGAALEPWKNFDAVTYSGTGALQNITGIEFAADFVNAKLRSHAYSWGMYDIVRGAGAKISSDLISAETSNTGLISFNSDGFTLDSDDGLNVNGGSGVAFCHKAGGTPITNNDGSISSQVSANPEAGFSIVKFAGAQAVGTVGHGLGKPPKFTIVKSMGSITNWHCYHSDVGNTKSIRLNLTSAPDTATSYWNDTSPTDSVFSLGTSDEANPSGVEVVAYCFAEIEGYSKIGSYTGNGSTDGTFVHCGFQPKYVLIKRTDAANDWVCLDSERDPYNQVDSSLFPNSASAEATNGFYNSDFTAAGFKVRASNVVVNASGGTYIYLAFAESPFRYSNAR